jgi:glutamate/tyrosine decarboxylase-like PLP-dependent enzyme
LPIWFSLLTYGKNGYKKFIEQNCRQAKILGDFIEKSNDFELLAQVNLNTICFRVSTSQNISTEHFLQKLNANKKVFLTPTIYGGGYAIRCAICNWSTTEADIELLIEEMRKILV